MARSDEPRQASAVLLLQTAINVVFVCSAVILVATYAAAPTVVADTVPVERETLARHPPALTFFVGAVLAVIALAVVGVARRWRWLFWLLLIAFAASVLHVPVTLCQLAGIIAGGPPRWYVILQLGTELVQVLLAAAMVRLFRTDGVWGMMRSHHPA
jgi:hypothetical protein